MTGPELKMNKTQYSIAGDPHFEKLPVKELLFIALRNMLELAIVCVSEIKVLLCIRKTLNFSRYSITYSLNQISVA